MDYILCRKCRASINEQCADEYDGYCLECWIEIAKQQIIELTLEKSRLNGKLDGLE